jgi:hypothetical protein
MSLFLIGIIIVNDINKKAFFFSMPRSTRYCHSGLDPESRGRQEVIQFHRFMSRSSGFRWSLPRT